MAQSHSTPDPGEMELQATTGLPRSEPNVLPARARAIAFEVEGTLRVGDQAYVLARRLEGHEELTITPGATLADMPLAEGLELPHALMAVPTRFEERTVFSLARPDDLVRFPKRARVELRLG